MSVAIDAFSSGASNGGWLAGTLGRAADLDGFGSPTNDPPVDVNQGFGFITIGGSATALLVAISMASQSHGANNPGTLTVTLNPSGSNQTMTLLGTVVGNGSTQGSATYLFGLVNPASGTGNIRINWTNHTFIEEFYVYAMSFTGTAASSVGAAFYGYNTANDGGSSGTTNQVSTSVPVASGDMAFALHINPFVGFNQPANNATGTEVDDDQRVTNNSYAQYFTGSGSVINARADNVGAGGTGDFWSASTVAIGTTPSGNQSLTASTGSFTLTGEAAGFPVAISFVQSKVGNNGSGGTATATFTNPIAAGSIIAAATVADNGATFSFSDGHGDTATDCGLGAINNTPVGTTIRVVAFLSPTTGAQSVTVTTSGTFCEVAIWEIAGLTSALFDKAVFANNSGTGTPSSGSTGTLSAANEAAIGYGVGNGNYTAAGSGWTNDTTPTSFGNVTEHQVVSSTTAIAATASFTQIGPDSQMVCATFMSSGGGGGTTLTAAQGSFTETGEAALFAEKMPAAQGSFALTGEAAGLVQGARLTSAQGSFVLTGEASFFKEVMSAIEGSFVLTGEAANLVQGTVLTGAQGSYVLTGEPALFPEVMPAAFGSFTLTGEPATLSATSGSTLTAAFGSFTLTGEAAGLVQGTVFTAAQGSYVLTGEAALFAEVMPASFGSYVLTGEPATLSGTSSNSLTAAFGSFTLTGEGALFAEAMPAAQGSYTLTGEAAGLAQGTVFTADQGSFVLTGEPVTFTAGTSVLAAATGHYVLTGHAATLTATGQAAAPLPTMKPYQPRAYPQIAPGIPMWHTGQNNDISSSVASLIETIKTLDARLRTGGL